MVKLTSKTDKISKRTKLNKADTYQTEALYPKFYQREAYSPIRQDGTSNRPPE